VTEQPPYATEFGFSDDEWELSVDLSQSVLLAAGTVELYGSLPTRSGNAAGLESATTTSRGTRRPSGCRLRR
jgi:hypothetical protein